MFLYRRIAIKLCRMKAFRKELRCVLVPVFCCKQAFDQYQALCIRHRVIHVVYFGEMAQGYLSLADN